MRIKKIRRCHDWAKSLGQHRLEQCLKYYDLGSHQGRVELHSTLVLLYTAILLGRPRVQDRSGYQWGLLVEG